MMLIILSLALLLAKRWSWRGAFALILCSAAWILLRDMNTYVLGLVGAITLLIAVLKPGARRWSIPVVAFLLLFLVSGASANRGLRWLGPLLHVVANRILSDPDAARYFTKRGMPNSPKIMALAGQWPSEVEYLELERPGFEELRDWLQREGKGVYARYLLSHKDKALEPFYREPRLFSPHVLDYYAPPTLHKSIVLDTSWAFDLLGAWSVPILAAVLLLVGLVLCVRSEHPLLLVSLLVLGSAVPILMMSYLADAAEVGRHFFMPAIQLCVVLLLTTVFCADVLLLARKRRAASVATAHQAQAGEPAV